MVTIYHNPGCSKSCKGLEIIELLQEPFTIVNYIEERLSKHELEEIIKKLRISPIELVRKKEEIWLKDFAGKELTEDQIVEALIQNPILIERPIVINGNKAVIARPAERIKEII